MIARHEHRDPPHRDSRGRDLQRLPSPRGNGGRRRAPRRRLGLTLTELLVVVAIVVILLGLAAPLLGPALEDRKVREGSRQVNAFITGAQARAAERGRPVGVWIERLPSAPNTSLQLFLAETPPPYSGNTPAARAVGSGGAGFTVNLTSSSWAAGVVRQGDMIRFNYRGPWYRITSNPPSPSGLTFAPNDTSIPPPTIPPTGVPFQIFRQPRRGAAAPLDLPNGIILDLERSGFGAAGAEFAVGGNRPVIIAFAPNGQVDTVFVNGQPFRPLSNIYLLIGRAEQAGNPPAPLVSNLNDLRNRWLSIAVRTGSISTSENMGGGTLNAARQFAVQQQAMGGM